MSLVLYLSLYFYKKHFEQEIYREFRLISSAIISTKLYDLKDSNQIKRALSENQKWCFSPYRTLLSYSSIEISEKEPMLKEDRITYSTLIKEDLYLSISVPQDHMQEDYKELMQTLLIVMFSILLLTSFVMLWRIRSLIQPLRCLTQFCHDIQERSNSITLCRSNSYEITHLFKAITSLLDKNRNLCESKVDLFKEAAHELKAPLTIMQARLNLLEQKEDYDLEKYTQETYADINLINSKLKELLFLKEIESDMQQNFSQEVCMMEQCKKMQERFARLLELKDIRIQTNWENSFLIYTHTKVLQKVMQVIFENVFIHAKSHSIISVEVFPEIKKMVITNELDKDPSTHNSSHIGLKIISRLADKLHYTFLAQEDEDHFITSIQFNS